MRYLFLFLILPFSFTITFAQASVHSLEYDGITRSYYLYVPPSYTGAEAVPLILVLHGGGGNASNMIRLTEGGFHALADKHGFIVAYPEGVNRHWNDGRAGVRNHSTADDIGFLSLLIDDLLSQYTIDASRVFSTGISNGGMMSYRLACELDGRIAGIAPVVANLSVDLSTTCNPDNVTDILVILGTDDPLMPYKGGQVTVLGGQRGLVLSANEILDFWTGQFDCENAFVEIPYPNHAPFDGTHITEIQYNNCNRDTRVHLMTIHGGGHTWAGGWQYLARVFVGRTSRDLDVSQVIWEFFASVAG